MLKKYLKNPIILFEKKNEYVKDKIKAFVRILGIYICFFFVFTLLIGIINLFTIKYFNFDLSEKISKSQSNRLFGKNKYLGVILVLLIAPIIEEFAFRFHLSLKKKHIFLVML